MSIFLKKQNFFFSLFLMSALLIEPMAPVLAFKMPSASSMAGDIEKRYHLDLGAIQNQGEEFNTSGNKKMTPEVSLFFNPTDPKEGQKITAKALPIYFSNNENDLYYTWYLKRVDCDKETCDYDDNGKYDEEDWKIEAMRILAQNGYDSSDTNYGSDDDNDGYKARFGGNNKVGHVDHCYFHDNVSGKNYEFAESTGSPEFPCPSGTSAACMLPEEEITSGSNDPSENFFTITSSTTCQFAGFPVCSSETSTASCSTGTPRCVADPSTTACGTALSSCTPQAESNSKPYCKHIFPEASKSGDGVFGKTEERFWGTNPHDPDTADNGNKDEANVIGLGQSSFTWNYVSGDKVGVAVEGTSMFPTKHDDGSNMIMWAFSKNNCSISEASGTGAYTKTIRGYKVSIPTVDIDMNKCLKNNLIDPAEGGQPSNLDVSVTATPESPTNDPTESAAGDTVVAYANISNVGRNATEVLYEWNVSISDNIRFDATSGGNVANITKELQNWGLLGNSKGNGLNTIELRLNIPQNSKRTAEFGTSEKKLGDFLSGGVGYLRFRVDAVENFSSGVVRKGKSDVIVKFLSTGEKINTYRVRTITETVRGITVGLDQSSDSICNDLSDRAVCSIIKNDIIGVKVDTGGLSDFQWAINGKPLVCSKVVSSECADEKQTNVNFFPVTGNVGDTYTVSVTANDSQSGKNITMARTFRIVEPSVYIRSTNNNVAWPKLLGQYKDITGSSGSSGKCANNLCDHFSETVFEAYAGSDLSFKRGFVPAYIESMSTSEWRLNGERVDGSTDPQTITFSADRSLGDIYSLDFVSRVIQSDDIRRALFAIWNVSPFDTAEKNMSIATQIELRDPAITYATPLGPEKYFAALTSYFPASILFTFRIFVSVGLILFICGLLYGLLERRRGETQ
ncbi:MAG: hypothetical protein HYV45_02590 [Candidatus Moranbacteria bacterium]|nr:hypothetical protein [Candidatus Moranbacteria bacterium]